MDNSEYWDIIDAMHDDRLIKNVNFNKGGENKILYANDENAKITIRGMEYLNNNAILMETYKGLKEIREWL